MRSESGGSDPLRTATNRIEGATSAGGVVAIVLLVALSPAGLGARSHSTFLAPFTGSTASPGSYSYTLCGATGGKAANWNEKTGAVTGEFKASSSYCTYLNAYAEAYGDEGLSVSLPFTVSTAGYYNATVDFHWKVTSAMSFSRGTCPAAANLGKKALDEVNCDWGAAWLVVADAYLYDLTNGTVVSQTDTLWLAGNYTDEEVTNLCNMGLCTSNTYLFDDELTNYSYQVPGEDEVQYDEPTGTSSGVGSIWTNSSSWNASAHYGPSTTLVPTHDYELITEFYFESSAELEGYNDSQVSGTYHNVTFNPGGSVSTSVSGLPSNGLKVTSATVTKVT